MSSLRKRFDLNIDMDDIEEEKKTIRITKTKRMKKKTRMTATILGKIKSKLKCWICIRDPHSEYGTRIRIHGVDDYGSHADPEPDPD